jgi:ElaB/YqjD/DUF883 family membrane-anchored ribosome-binding protein
MKRVLLLATALCVAAPSVFAQQPTKPMPTLPAEAPVKTELDRVFSELGTQVSRADVLLKQLRDTAHQTPDNVVQQVQTSAMVLSGLVDKLKQNGDIAGQLLAVRNAAATHLKRVQEMPKGMIDEEDRTKILSAWQQVLQGADTAQANMATMRDSLNAALARLRERSLAIGELMLAAQYQQVIDSFTHWIGDLKGTVDSLHQLLGTPAS